MKKARIPLLLIAVAVIAWHVFLCGSVMENPDVDINPITDVATVKTPGAASFGFTDPRAVEGFNFGRGLIGALRAEHDLNLYGRRYMDVYAMILPYRAIIIDK